ncbi:MAG: NADH-quinone oxidoreductase subunit L [Bacteroidota bacterium]
MNTLIVLLPFLGALVIGMGGFFSEGFRRQEKLIGGLATLAVAIPFGIVVLNFFSYQGTPIDFATVQWMQAGNLDISFSYTLDELSLLMAMIVNGVGALIHIYSIGYMHGDKGFYKFFAYLNLFIFSMNNLILGDNMVVMFLGWEGVGVCSYLLIGFWYEDMMKAKAAQKAFVANRIGDFAMLIAMFLVFKETGSLMFSDLNAAVGSFSSETTFWIAFLVFIAATGKSAQIPLYVWLPDAMAGPTPVSALIHAATMVTSGIYLIARIHPIYVAAPEVMAVVVIVAALTAIVAALIALAQNDIKKVLAYSTVSQLGFMFMALGAGAFTAAIFHVMTHAFFKACLFLGSGSVIHAMEHMHTVDDPQDIRTMGGLSKYMPSTSRTFWISTLAIAGIPFLSGFFSKDEIMASVFFYGYENSLYYFVYGVGMLTAFLTAFYMTRVTYLTFNGKERFPQEKKPHESPALMTLPLWVLAVLAIVAGYLGLPYVMGHGEYNMIGHGWLGKSIDNMPMMEEHATTSMELFLIGFSALVAIIGVLAARNLYRKHDLSGDDILMQRLGGLYGAMEQKFYVDELYQYFFIKPFMWFSESVIKPFDENVVDGAVRGIGDSTGSIGEVFRKLQSGLIQNYMLVVSIGVLAVLTFLIFG